MRVRMIILLVTVVGNINDGSLQLPSWTGGPIARSS
jgi:hypothetical protein